MEKEMKTLRYAAVAVVLTFLSLWCVSHEVRLQKCKECKPSSCTIAVPMHQGRACHCKECGCCPDCPSQKKPKCKAGCKAASELPTAILVSGRLGTCNCEDCDCCAGCHR